MLRWKASLLFALFAAGAALAIHGGWLDFIADQEQVASYLNQHGLPGLLMIAAAGTLYTGLGGPRQLLAFVSGYAMGGPAGTLFSTLVTALGAAGCFYMARRLLRPVLARRFARRMAAFDLAVAEQPLLKILMIRLLPVGSNLLTNLLAGASGIRLAPFLTGSALGYLPQMLIFALTGAGLGSADQHQLLLGTLLFALATVIGTVLYRHHRTRTLTAPFSSQI